MSGMSQVPPPAGRQDVLEAVLASLDQFIEIGRRRPAIAAGGPAWPLAPWPRAAIALASRHRHPCSTASSVTLSH